MSMIMELLNNNFIPHGHCFFWIPSLLWTFVLSDAGITLAYFSIPVGIYKVINLSNLQNNKRLVRVFYLFAAFIFACGTTHLIKIITIWHPIYWIAAYVNVFTAIISLTAAYILFRTINETSRYITGMLESEKELGEINTRLLDARELLDYQNKAIEFLNETNELLETCANEKEFSEIVVTVADKLTEADAVLLYLIKDNQTYAELTASRGDVDDESVTLDLDKCWAYRQHDVFPKSDIGSDLTCNIHPLDKIDHTCYPIVGSGQIVGLLQLRGIRKPETENAEMHLTTLLKRAGLELTNLRLRQNLLTLSVKDPLTGLYNRRYLEDTAGKELKRSQRAKKDFGFVMLDLDNFKDINDQYGHDTGDSVLKAVSEIINNTIRNQDVACRYGGEEFAVLLPETSEKGALQCAEKIRKNIEEMVVHANSKETVNVKTSCGIAIFPVHGENIEEVIKNADTALYSAKKAGKNKTIIYGRPGE